jgi:ATP-dependent Clp protease ATP-binding subunit ClpC
MQVTPRVEKILDSAKSLATSLNQSEVTHLHLLSALLEADDAYFFKALNEMGHDPLKLKSKLDEGLNKGEEKCESGLKESKGFSETIGDSHKFAEALKHCYVCTDHIFACAVFRNYIDELFGIHSDELKEKLVHHLTDGGVNSESSKEEEGSINKNFPNLSKYGHNMNLKAAEGKYEVIYGRDKEIEDLSVSLNNKLKKGSILVGDSGVGKTSIVEGLANLIASGGSSILLSEKIIFYIDVGAVVSGTKFRGEFEARFRSIIKEASNNDVILFIDDMHSMIGAGDNENSTDASSLLKPALSSGDVTVIGATTFEQYRLKIQKDKDLARRFEVVKVKELDRKDLFDVLKSRSISLSKYHRVNITDDTINECSDLCKKYIHDSSSPDREIHFLDSLCSHIKVKGAKKTVAIRELEHLLTDLMLEHGDVPAVESQKKAILDELGILYHKWASKILGKMFEVKRGDIHEVLSRVTSIPLFSFSGDQNKKYIELDKTLAKSVIGQEAAIKPLHKCLVRYKSGVRDLSKPIGSFVFLGPTGVGKTYLAKNIAAEMFGSEGALKIFDMSEYMEKHSVSKLIGSPPGYVGHESGGQLVEYVSKNPYSVLLFDEIEKAHPEIFNLFLQILEEGKITDSQGRSVSFSNSLIIMTGNIGSRELIKGEKLGFGHNISNEEKELNADMELKKLVPPEIMGRIDKAIYFKPLDKDTLGIIVKMQLKELKNRCSDTGIKLSYGKNIEKYVIDNISSVEYGAREIKKVIQNRIADTISLQRLMYPKRESIKVSLSKKEGRIIASSV